MRRFLFSIMMFCLLCGGGLMILGSKFGAERTIEATTASGRKVYVSAFDGKGAFAIWGSGVEIPSPPEPPELPELPELPGPGGIGETNASLTGETITQLNVYAAAGEIKIQSGDGWAVSLDGGGNSYELYHGYLDVSADMGDVTVTVPRDVRLDWLSVDSDAGSITLDGIQTDSLELDQDFGETVLKNCIWDYASIDNDCGSINGTGLVSGGLEASADMGEVDLKGDFTGETDIEASMGSVKLTLDGRQSDYDIELEADLGVITLNGQNCGQTVSQSGGPHELDISCSLGGIEVRFSE